jgi:hypothetical protein
MDHDAAEQLQFGLAQLALPLCISGRVLAALSCVPAALPGESAFALAS